MYADKAAVLMVGFVMFSKSILQAKDHLGHQFSNTFNIIYQ